MSSEPKQNSKKVTYKDAGVDVEKADDVVEWMKGSLVGSDPHPESLVSGIGGFAALFKADFQNMEEPLLVSSTDGIGTKILMGIEAGQTSGLAQDLVGMCVNDLLCTGAEPLFFLDYFASSFLKEGQLKEFLLTLKRSCMEAGVSLIGGETAELPGLYQKGHFDAAGFSVGVVDKKKSWGAHKVNEGDVAFCIESSGFHSNGFSLVRKLFGENGGGQAPVLLEPTKLYSNLNKAIKNNNLYDKVHACAHITGGGLDNSLRVIPDSLSIKFEDWQWPEIFEEAQKLSGLSRIEMLKTFNCGVGMVYFVSPEASSEFEEKIPLNYKVISKGKVVNSLNKEKKWEIV